MKNNKINQNYFFLTLKRNLPVSAFYLILFFLIYVVPLLLINPAEKLGFREYYPDLSLTLLVSIPFFVIAFVDVIIQGKYLMNKKSIDTYYSLPIKRHIILISHLSSGLIMSILPFSLMYWLGAVICTFKFPFFNFIYFLFLYLILILLYICNYIINAFFMSKANSILDGAFFIILGTTVLPLILFSLYFTLSNLNINSVDHFLSKNFDYILYVLPVAGFIYYSIHFEKLILYKYFYYCFVKEPKNEEYLESMGVYSSGFDIGYIIAIIVMMIICLTLLILLFNKRKPESSEDTSNSLFGYSVMVPVYAVFAMLPFVVNRPILDGVIAFIFIGILYIIGTMCQYRTFKIPLYRWIMLGVIFLLVFI